VHSLVEWTLQIKWMTKQATNTTDICIISYSVYLFHITVTD